LKSRGTGITITRWVWCACCTMVLAACGGGGESSTPVVTVPPPVAQLSLLGPDYGDALSATECGTATGNARQARFPMTGAIDTRRQLRSPMVMRTDGAGGLLVAENEDRPFGDTTAGRGMYRVDGAGAKTLLNLPYTRVFDVVVDGTIWYATDGATIISYCSLIRRSRR
jgi:hypothetical protein